MNAAAVLLAVTVAWPAVLVVVGVASWQVAALSAAVVGAVGVTCISHVDRRGNQRVTAAERFAECDRRWFERQLHRAESRAERDPLTGLLNRRGLERIVLDLTDRTASSIGVLVIDVDDFKGVNDRLGHEAGDEVLRNLADRLVQCVRPSDAIARTGGDEFVIVLPDAGPGDVENVARRIHESTASGDNRLPALPGVSIGASGTRVHDRVAPEEVEELVRRADRSLYRAKAAKRSTTARRSTAPVASRGEDQK